MSNKIESLSRLLKYKESHHVSGKDLALDPSMQMRTEMDHTHIEDLAESMRNKGYNESKPIKIVVVQTALDEVFYVVDGFHRTRAAQLAEIEMVPADVYFGSYDEAVMLAMSANFQNGKNPNDGDATKAIGRLLEMAPDFGYKSEAVGKWLMSFNIGRSTALDKASPLIAEIKAKRNAKIMELHEEGLSQSAISKEINCARSTVQKALEGCRKIQAGQIGTQESTIRGHSADIAIVDDVHDEDDGYLDEDEESGPIVNPMDAILAKREEKAKEAAALAETTAMNQALQEQQEESADTTATSDVVTKEYIDAKAAELRRLISENTALVTSTALFHVKAALAEHTTAKVAHA